MVVAYDARDDQPFRRGDDPAQSFRQERVANGIDATDGSAFSPLGLSPLRDAAAKTATEKEHAAKCSSFLDSRRFTAIHQDGDKLYFIDARNSARHYDALGV